MDKNVNIGFGAQQFNFAVYIANRPNLAEYQDIGSVVSLQKNEIYSIGQACGNGWRKVFNVYAKLLYALESTSINQVFVDYRKGCSCWQELRDQYLLQANSDSALLFSPPQLSVNSNTIHIICGRTYAKQLISQGLDTQLSWLDQEFAIDHQQNIIVCPYFDYRQLSNIKIIRLVELIKELR